MGTGQDEKVGLRLSVCLGLAGSSDDTHRAPVHNSSCPCGICLVSLLFLLFQIPFPVSSTLTLWTVGVEV